MSQFDVDWVVVGSGFGGSVSALRLAEKGYSVRVLECGRRFRDEDFPKSTWDLRRYFWAPRTVLVTGAGPIGLLAAMIGTQHGLDVHVLDRVTSGPKPELVRALGATYHTERVTDIG